MTPTPHPIAALFPMMNSDELRALADDIEAHGLLVPIVIHEEMVLDGRNRLAACGLVDVEPSFVQWIGDSDPTAWVVSQNLHRRHLTESQRAMVASKMATLRPGKPVNRSIDPFTQSDAANLLNVSVPSVKRARTVLNEGIPELAAAVDAGEVPVSKAALIAKAPSEEQGGLLEVARTPHVARNTGDNEWYTPFDYLDAARGVLGTIDLDPASSEVANQSVEATRFYSAEDDGLTKTWAGKLWMNPPYSKELCPLFCAKMVDSYMDHSIDGEVSEAIVLVNNATETKWFQKLLTVCTAVCFPASRIRFLKSTGERGAPLQGQAVLYLGPNPEVFIEYFDSFGACLVVSP